MAQSTKQPVPSVRILYNAETVAQRVAELGELVVQRYKDQDPIFVCLLTGAMPFAVELMRAITASAEAQAASFDPQFASMIISTYGNDKIAGEPRVVADLPPHISVTNRLVILLDDLIDTGTTMAFTDNLMRSRGAAQVEAGVLVQKVGNPNSLYPEVAFHGFESPYGQWLFGMGMDGDPREPKGSQKARWLKQIMIAK